MAWLILTVVSRFQSVRLRITSKRYSLYALGITFSHIITMTEKEFIILSANKDMFAKYGVQVIHQGHTDDTSTVLGKKMNNAGETI